MSLATLEQLVRSGQYAQAMQVFLELLKDEQALGKRDLAFAFHCASISQYHLADYPSAHRYGQRAEQHAREAEDLPLLGRIWINLIALSLDCGDTSLAIQYGNLWLSNTSQFAELMPQLPRVHYNLSRAHRFAKNYEAMFEHLRMAVECRPGSHLPAAFWVQVHQTYAWNLYRNEQIYEGDQHLRTADELVEDDDTEGQREQELLQAYRAYHVDDARTALKMSEEFLANEAGSTERQRFWALWMVSMIATDRGQFEHGYSMACLALSASIRLGVSEYMNAASQARARALKLQEMHQPGDT